MPYDGIRSAGSIWLYIREEEYVNCYVFEYDWELDSANLGCCSVVLENGFCVFCFYIQLFSKCLTINQLE